MYDSFGLLSNTKIEVSSSVDRVADNGSMPQLLPPPNKDADNVSGLKQPFGAARLVSQNADDRHAYRARPSTALAGPRFELQYNTPGSSSSSSSSKDENLDGLDRQRRNRLFPNPIVSNNEDSRIYEGKAKPQVQLQTPPPPPPPSQRSQQQDEPIINHHHHHHQPPLLRPKSAGPSYRAVPTSRSNNNAAAGGIASSDVEPIVTSHHRIGSNMVDGNGKVKAQGLGIAVGDPVVPSKQSSKGT